MKVLIIINTEAGSFNLRVREIIDDFYKKNKDKLELDLRYVDSSNIRKVIIDNVFDKDIIVAGGGDGTINTAVNYIYSKNIKLGILPIGTFNHLAKDLNIPLDIKKALDLILNPKYKAIDLVWVNNEVFLNHSGLGIYAKSLEQRIYYQKRGFKKMKALIVSAVKVFFKFHAFTITVYIDGKKRRIKTPIIFVGNGSFHLSLYKKGTRDQVDDSKLWIYYLDCVKRICLLKTMFSFLTNRIKSDKSFMIFSGKEVKISTKKKRVSYSLDGELKKGRAPIFYKILPKSLKVLIK